MTNNPIIPVPSDDAEMVGAMKKARDLFPEFWREVSDDYRRAIPALAHPMVKAYFNDENALETGEHLWVEGIDYDGELISGTVMSNPGRLRSVRVGQYVQFPLKRLSDWLYVADGRAVGAFTVKLLRTRMSAESRMQHDSHYPFRFE